MKKHYEWRSRDGISSTTLSLRVIRQDGLAPDEIAKRMGWPGHAGRRRDYAKDDLRCAAIRLKSWINRTWGRYHAPN